MPGGVIEKFESPREAAIRECKEEIGVDVEGVSFLCADYKRGNSDIGDAIHFLFSAKLPQACKIRIDQNEIKQFQWLPFEMALSRFDSHLSSRVKVGLKALIEGTPFYCEDGELK